MQLSSFRVDWTPPRTWFVTARLLEVAAPVALLGWLTRAGRPSSRPPRCFAPTGEEVPGTALPRPGGACSPCSPSATGRRPSAASSPASCSSRSSRSCTSPSRWATRPCCAGRSWPSGPWRSCSTSSCRRHRGRARPRRPHLARRRFGHVQHRDRASPSWCCPGSAVPVLCLLLLSVSALWWLRLPVEFDAPEDEAEEAVREPRRWRPAPGAGRQRRRPDPRRRRADRAGRAAPAPRSVRTRARRRAATTTTSAASRHRVRRFPWPPGPVVNVLVSEVLVCACVDSRPNGHDLYRSPAPVGSVACSGGVRFVRLAV